MDKRWKRLLPCRRRRNCSVYFTGENKNSAGQQKPVNAAGSACFNGKQIQFYTGWKKGFDLHQYQKSMAAAYTRRLLGFRRGRWQFETTGKRRPASSLMFAKISPDGKKAAYVSEYNLYVEDLASGEVNHLPPMVPENSSTVLSTGCMKKNFSAGMVSAGAPTANRSPTGR